mgnify:CR=1 FL=1|tara:strand:- start:100 stop:1452 length:1353 start_codon:yes stop_codon:yes gene_type:complete
MRIYTQDIESIITEYNSEYGNFLDEFGDSKVEEIILSKSFPSSLPKAFLIDQLISQKKTHQKIPSWISAKKLVYPPPIHVEQSSSEWTGKYKAKLVETDIIIDGTGGMGVDSYFFAKEGIELWYVESNPDLCSITQNNFNVFGINARVVSGSLESFLVSNEFTELCNSPHTLGLFLDPSRRVHGNKVVSIQDSEPKLFELWEQISTSVDQLIVKVSPMVHIDELLNKGYPPESIHAVSVNNELKELLYRYRYTSDRLSKQDKSKICYHAVNIKKNETVEQGQDSFTVLVDADGIAPVTIPYIDTDQLTKLSSTDFVDDNGFANRVKSYLYDPIVGVKKLGCMDHLGAGFDLLKLNKHTHLYHSKDWIKHFPGRIFEVLDGFSPSHKSLKKWFNNYGSKFINIWSLNYPFSSEAIKKKYSIQDGGELTLIFTRLYPDLHWVFVARRVNSLS